MSPISAPLHAARRFVSDLSAVSTTATLPCAARYLTKVASTLPAIVRSRSLAPADAGMADRVCHFRPFDTDVLLPGSLFGGAREMYARRVYFALPNFRLRPGDTAVDLGANHGVFTTLAACIASKVVAVEAQSGYFDKIRSNLRLNRVVADVALVFGLVGAETGAFAERATLASASDYGQEPPTLSMKRVLEEHHVERIDFLKIDIEGSEFSLLRADVEWLANVSKVAMEVHPDFGDPAELVATFTRLGFRTELRDGELRPARRLTSSGYLYAWRASAS